MGQLSNGALSAGCDEYEIRRRMIENNVVESIIIMPQNMFYLANISVRKKDLEQLFMSHVLRLSI